MAEVKRALFEKVLKFEKERPGEPAIFTNIREISKHFSVVPEPSKKKINYAIARKMEKWFLRRVLERIKGGALTDRERHELRKALEVSKKKGVFTGEYRVFSGKVKVYTSDPYDYAHEYGHWLKYKDEKWKRILKRLFMPWDFKIFNVSDEVHAGIAELVLADVFEKSKKWVPEKWKYKKIDVAVFKLAMTYFFKSKLSHYKASTRFLIENIDRINEIMRMKPSELDKVVKKFLRRKE